MAGQALSQARTVVLTRMPEDNLPLRAKLENAGLRVVEAPCLDISPIDPMQSELSQLPDHFAIDAAMFSSRHAVEGYFRWLRETKDNSRSIRPGLVAAVGPATAKAVVVHGWAVDVVAEPATGQEMAKRLGILLGKNKNVLAPRGTKSLNTAAKSLAKQGHSIYPLTVYANRATTNPRVDGPFDLVLLASPSAATRFFSVNENASDACVAAIGPTTTKRLVSLGANPIEADATDTETLAKLIIEIMKQKEIDNG